MESSKSRHSSSNVNVTSTSFWTLEKEIGINKLELNIKSNDTINVFKCVRKRFSVSDCFDLFDRNNLHLAQIKRKIFSILPHYSISIGESDDILLKRFRDMTHPVYLISGRNWSLVSEERKVKINGYKHRTCRPPERNYLEFRYVLQDELGNPLMIFEPDEKSDSFCYLINIYNQSLVLPSLCIAVSIELAIAECFKIDM